MTLRSVRSAWCHPCRISPFLCALSAQHSLPISSAVRVIHRSVVPSPTGAMHTVWFSFLLLFLGNMHCLGGRCLPNYLRWCAHPRSWYDLFLFSFQTREDHDFPCLCLVLTCVQLSYFGAAPFAEFKSESARGCRDMFLGFVALAGHTIHGSMALVPGPAVISNSSAR